jgi:ABC transporter substrate binding protein (PQQ-dependent alcohol dehydrogenase system)
MKADAERQWQRKEPGSRARAHAWHRSFKKYAAAQLNSRFRKRFGQPMDDEAWAGWAAVRLLSDMIVREQIAAPAQLLEALQTNLAFDGQKGIDMSFRDTGQLRQPLLLVDDDRIVGEAPVRGVVGITNLDSLGIPFCLK